MFYEECQIERRRRLLQHEGIRSGDDYMLEELKKFLLQFEKALLPRIAN